MLIVILGGTNKFDWILFNLFDSVLLHKLSKFRILHELI